MDLQQNKAVVRHLFEVINNGELDQLRDVVDANVVDHNAVIFMQPEGPGAVEDGNSLAPARLPRSPHQH
jgi:ketosteroid isomerase-like protein